MLVVRFKVTCQPGKAEHALGLFEPVVAPSRALDGTVSFDIARDITDPNAIIAVEVFEDRDALDRQEALPEVAKVLGALPELIAAPPEATIFHVSSTESPMG
jgi:quinol monooxygenase YgiN